MDHSSNNTDTIFALKPVLSTPKTVERSAQSCTLSPNVHTSPATEGSFMLCKTTIPSKRSQLVTRALSREGLRVESSEERQLTSLPSKPYACLSAKPSLLTEPRSESSLHQDSIKPLLSTEGRLIRKFKLRDRNSIQSNITQDEESVTVQPLVNIPTSQLVKTPSPIPRKTPSPALPSSQIQAACNAPSPITCKTPSPVPRQGSSPVPQLASPGSYQTPSPKAYRAVGNPGSPSLIESQQNIETFFNELNSAIKDKKFIDEKFLIRLPDITEKFIELKTGSEALPSELLEQIEQTLRVLVQILGTQDKLVTKEFTSNMQALTRMLNAKSPEELQSAFEFCNLEKKLIDCEEQMKSTIASVACRGLVELKKLSYPASDIQFLSLAILTLFSEVDCNIDVNVSCKVLSSRAWECMTNYLNKPGEVMQTLRKYTDFVKESRISNSVYKKVNDYLNKVTEEGLRLADFSYVTFPLYKYIQLALNYYDTYNQVKLHLPPSKKKIMKQPVPRCPSARKVEISKQKPIPKSPTKMRQLSLPNDDKMRSLSTPHQTIKPKPFIPKLNLQKALGSAHVKRLSVFSTQDKSEKPVSSQNSVSEAVEIVSVKNDMKNFMKYKPVRSTIVRNNSKKHSVKDTKTIPEAPYSLRHQYSLSLGEDKKSLFTKIEPHPEAVSNQEPSADIIKLTENPKEISLQIHIDSKDNVKFSDSTPKFSEGPERFEIIEELSEKLTFREQTKEYISIEPQSLLDVKSSPSNTQLEEFTLELESEKPKDTPVLSVANFECMSLPPVFPVICTQASHHVETKPVEDIHKYESKLSVSDLFQINSSLEPPCSFDVSSIELDESIRNLIPLVTNIDEFYKDWASRILDTNESFARGSFRKNKVREILKKRGISQDYSGVNRSFDESSVESRRLLNTQKVQLKLATEPDPLASFNKICKIPESEDKIDSKAGRYIQKAQEVKESFKSPKARGKMISSKPRENIAPKRKLEPHSSWDQVSRDSKSRSLSKSSIRSRAPVLNSRENKDRSFSKTEASQLSDSVKPSAGLKQEEYDNMMSLAKLMIMKERRKLQGLLDKYQRR
jgi:hypothetical protein